MNTPFDPSFLASQHNPQLSYFEQIRIITTHPFFTGQCPDCKQKIALVARTVGKSVCSSCGWTDHDEPLA